MNLIKLFRVLITSIFLLVGFYHLLNAQQIQFDLIEIGMSNWIFSLPLFYLLIGLEFTLSILLIMNKSSKLIEVTIIIFYTLFTFFTLISGIDTSFILSYNFWGNVLLPFTLLLLLISYLKIVHLHSIKLLWMSLTFICSASLGFMFNPIYLEDYGGVTLSTPINENVESQVVNFISENTELKSHYTFTSFLSTGCPACIETSKKLYAASQNSNTKLIFIFSDTESNIEIFMNYLHFKNVTYLNINRSQFSYFSQSRTPTNYVIENGKVVFRSTVFDLSYYDLDKYF